MSTPLVSVVVPTYGRPEDVTDAVATVRGQTYSPVELVVVDDCSPDPIEPRILDIDLSGFECVRCLRHEKNRGAAVARSTGIEAANGEFVAFLDDDDRWIASKLGRQVEALQGRSPDAGVAYSGMRIVDGAGETLRIQSPAKSGDLTKTLLCRNVVGSYSTVMVRMAAIEDTGLPEERFPSWQDMEWYVRLSRNWEFVAVPDPLAIIYQADDHEQISDDFEAVKTESYELFVEKFRPIAAEYGRLFERKMMAWAAFRVGGYNALRTGNFHDARRFLLRAVARYPFEPTFWVYLAVALGGESTYKTAKRLKRLVAD